MIGYEYPFHDRSTCERADPIPLSGTSALLYPPAPPKPCELHKLAPARALLFFAFSLNQIALIYVQWRTLSSFTFGPPCYTPLSPHNTILHHHPTSPPYITTLHHHPTSPPYITTLHHHYSPPGALPYTTIRMSWTFVSADACNVFPTLH
jgi:hypothetical protein